MANKPTVDDTGHVVTQGDEGARFVSQSLTPQASKLRYDIPPQRQHMQSGRPVAVDPNANDLRFSTTFGRR
jgi:hypothetical protein